jgi:ferritin-like metal-binding protein YciE
MNREKLDGLLYEALETEQGGVKIYETAVRAAVNEDLREEWQEYLEQTRRHVQILEDVFEALGLDTDKQTPGRQVVSTIGEALVEAMELAQKSGPREAAEIVAAECVVLAETKDHLNWELLGEAAQKLSGEERKALKRACEEVEDEEDEHLYHTTGWTRELHMQALGLPAVLPPPEEEKEVKTAIGAARAKQQRKEML